ncbi:MAG: NHLP leader peptide family RiPP precursor [Lapillicoccus sp.]
MSDRNHNDRHEVEDRLTSRAVNDPEFRRQLVDDPHTAVRDELGVSLPSEIRITVLEETADHLYLVIPQEHVRATSDWSDRDELSDAELGSVAGGSFIDDLYSPGSGQSTAARAVDGVCRPQDPTS